MKNKGMRRSISSNQLKMRQTIFTFDASIDLVDGFDRFGIKEVIDLGAGGHTFVLSQPFERDLAVSGHAMYSADSTLEVISVAYDRVTIQTKTSGTDADTAYCLTITGSDGRYDQ